MPIPRYNIFTPADAARVSKLQLTARQVVEGVITGLHKSPHRGFSVEFSEHREYVPGDDTRHLDWKVLGRSERYYIKQYEQETNFVANLLLDGSESMKYGSGAVSKFDYAKVMAACLAYLRMQSNQAALLNTNSRLHSTAATGTILTSRIRSRTACTDPSSSSHVQMRRSHFT